jgi:hypothetical protein
VTERRRHSLPAIAVSAILGFAFVAVVRLGAQAPAASAPPPSAQLTGVRYMSGQNVAPVFEGWEKNPDGSFSFVFGYLNRNYEEEPEIPIGVNNSFSPGAADRGQPTHFYTRRQQFMFKVRVPADFGKQELVWTLTRAGKTEKAVAHLQLEWELTEIVYSQNRAGLARDSVTALPNQAPMVFLNATPLAATVGTPMTLSATVSDDGIPKPPAARGTTAASGTPAAGAAAAPATAADSAAPQRSGAASARGRGGAPQQPPLINLRQGPVQQALIKPPRSGLAVTWTHWRGPGRITFTPQSGPAKEGTPVTTLATFSAPGTYVVRAFVDDGVLLGSNDVTVNVAAK